MILKYDHLKYGDRVILQAGEISVPEGCITVVSGESGSGKSTLFRYLEGNVKSCRISTCPQVPVFMEGLTIRDHLEMIRNVFHLDRDYSEDAELLDLTNVMDRTPAQLSGGEQKRAAFLMCVMQRAYLYMMDEPTASLNEEYGDKYIQLIERLKEEGKSVLVFTHDESLMDRADCHDAIEEGKLVTLRSGSAGSLPGKKESVKPDDSCIPAYLSKAEKGQKKYIRLISGLLVLCILLCAFFYGYGDIVHKAQESALRKITSDEIVAFKNDPSCALTENGDVFYTMTSEYPLSEEEIAEMASIDHVSSVEWRFDVDVSVYSDYINYAAEGFELHGYIPYELTLYMNDTEKGKVEMQDGYKQCTYLKDHKSEKDIAVDFSNDGIYLSAQLAEYLETELGVSEEDLGSAELEITVDVPVYNSYGRYEGGSDFITIWTPEVERDTLRLPVGGILRESSFGLVDYSAYVLYIERSDLEGLMAEHRKSEGRKVYVSYDYVYGEDDQLYFNELPDGYNMENIARVVEEQVYQPTAFSVFPDAVENIPAITEALEEKGYYSVSSYIENSSVSTGVGSVRKSFLYAAAGLGTLVLLGRLVILMLRKKEEKEKDEYFRKLGFTNEDILKFRNTFCLKNCLKLLVFCAAALAVLYMILTMALHETFIPSVSEIILVIVLVVLYSYVLVKIFDRVRLC